MFGESVRLTRGMSDILNLPKIKINKSECGNNNIETEDDFQKLIHHENWETSDDDIMRKKKLNMVKQKSLNANWKDGVQTHRKNISNLMGDKSIHIIPEYKNNMNRSSSGKPLNTPELDYNAKKNRQNNRGIKKDQNDIINENNLTPRKQREQRNKKQITQSAKKDDKKFSSTDQTADLINTVSLNYTQKDTKNRNQKHKSSLQNESNMDYLKPIENPYGSPKKQRSNQNTKASVANKKSPQQEKNINRSPKNKDPKSNVIKSSTVAEKPSQERSFDFRSTMNQDGSLITTMQSEAGTKSFYSGNTVNSVSKQESDRKIDRVVKSVISEEEDSLQTPLKSDLNNTDLKKEKSNSKKLTNCNSADNFFSEHKYNEMNNSQIYESGKKYPMETPNKNGGQKSPRDSNYSPEAKNTPGYNNSSPIQSLQYSNVKDHPQGSSKKNNPRYNKEGGQKGSSRQIQDNNQQLKSSKVQNDDINSQQNVHKESLSIADSKVSEQSSKKMEFTLGYELSKKERKKMKAKHKRLKEFIRKDEDEDEYEISKK